MKTKLIFAFSFLLFLFSCEKEFIETDLSGKSLTVIAPADNDTVATAVPLFWWNEINGARNYRLQIVYPDFNAPQQLLYDTTVEADRFYPSLSPGYTYYWRIRPENGSSHGDWVTRRLTIDSTVSLSAQTVMITSPASNGYATSTTTTVTSFSYTFAEGNYTFSVRAENASSFTPESVRTFTVDQTAPTSPVLVSPVSNAYYASPPASLLFDWVSASDALTDSLYIATDSTFASGIQTSLLLNSTQSSYSWTGVQAATIYFWRVRSTDAAGNRSNYSSTNKFTVN